MYRGFAAPELPGRRPHRGIVLGYKTSYLPYADIYIQTQLFTPNALSEYMRHCALLGKFI
jgi:hypothetical protein